MKTPTLVILIAGISLGFMSCSDSGSSNLNNFAANNNEPVRLTTTQNNDFNTWNLDESINFTTMVANDYSNWSVYINDGGGNLNQTVPGDCNKWDGVLNTKQATPYTCSLRTTTNNDFNEWKYEDNTTIYIRTVVKDSLNDFKFFDASNHYLAEIKTANRTNFNKWKYIDFQNVPCSNATFICLFPAIITVTQYF